MPDTAPARIFISYSRKDGADIAATLRKDLESQDLSVWQDIIALEGHRDWWSQIEDALRAKALQHFVLAVTQGALQSPVVRREIRLARQEGKTVSAVRGPGLDLAAVPRWFGHVYDFEIPEQRALFMRVLEGPSKQNRVPMMAPEPPADFVQRPREFEALKRKLLDTKGDAVAITAALRGAGGYGKTTLAKALAHDGDVIDAYFDGILWVELGEQPGNLLSIVSDLIETLTGERPALESLNAAASKLGEALGERRILLVVDDAWREQDLRPFLQGGRNTTRLITTRRDDILPLNAPRQPVDAMQSGEALELLEWGLPGDQATAQKRELEALAGRLGEWAQLLKLVNGFLRDRVVKARQPLAQALMGVNERLDIKGLTAFDAKNEADRAHAIARTVSVSLELLDASERARFAELAVFPEDEDIPISVVFRLWRDTGQLEQIDTEDLLQRLQSLSLLLSLDLSQRHFRLHDTMRNFLRNQAGQEGRIALHKLLLGALERYYEANFDFQITRYFSAFVPMHLAEAGHRGPLDALLLSPAWMQGKLSALRTPQSLISDYDRYAADDFSRLIGRTLRLTAGIITRDRNQLLPQLIGRLISVEGNVASKFREQARHYIKEHVRPAFLPMRPSLTTPGAETARLDGHGAAVRALVLLADGRLASGCGDNTIRLWDLTSGAETARLDGHGGYVNALALLPDGRLASGSGDNTIRLWDLTSAAESGRLEGHVGYVNALAPLADGRLASGSGDRIIRLWDLASGVEIARLDGHGAAVRSLAVLQDGRLASGFGDGTIRLWDLSGRTKTVILQGHTAAVRALAVLPDGHLASGSSDNVIRLWDPKSGLESARLEGHYASVNALAVLRDSSLASGSDDRTVRLWDVASGAEKARLEGHGGYVRALAVPPDGRLASGSDDRTIRMWDLASSAKTARLQGHTAAVRTLAVLRPDERLASGSDDNTLRLWELASGAEVASLEGPGAAIRTLARLPDGRIALGSTENSIRLWNLSGAETGTLEGHVGYVNALALLPDGRLASGSGDNTVRIWDLASGAEVARLEGHGGYVNALALLPDGRLVSGFGDGTIRIWDLTSKAKTERFKVCGAAVRALVVLPDGHLASASNDNSIRFWDLARGAEVARLDGHGAAVRALALLPGGHLASGSDDKTIRLWNLATRAEMAQLEVDAAVYCLAALPDCRLIAGDGLGRLHWLEILE
jgi:WD40 repeat protein